MIIKKRERVLSLIGMLCLVSCTYNNLKNNAVEQLEHPNRIDSTIVFPPVPDGCRFVGRWHLINTREPSIGDIYIMMFSCEGTHYITQNGVTIKLLKNNDRFYELEDNEIVSNYYIKIIDGNLHYLNDSLGDFTEKAGWVVQSY